MRNSCETCNNYAEGHAPCSSSALRNNRIEGGRFSTKGRYFVADCCCRDWIGEIVY